MDSQVLVYIGEYGEASTLVKALALDNKGNVTFFGSDGVFSEQFIEEAGLRSEGSYLIGPAPNEESARLEKFKERYKGKFKSEISSYAANAYDAAMILLNAIKNSRAENSEAVAREVAKTNYTGLTGLIGFDEIGDPLLPRLSVYKVVNQEFTKP